ncbi:MarR family winged helix-turn-helix transcriptional regulator [Klebsiella michiganensis]|uniref:MarR family winged helix-turn-helix transcriptional regulator n=1 Tax=Klebsiella michiganensis TaxID=1134687 RepID=UPI002DB9D2A4|nr:MarR family winged helix-turn-helix transcriptional regulator [Klebsiella michiganensis]MEB6467693.1 MarR family winged helix-turn-helix transcriptional regulator [Klebsiella michiganensis]
MKKNSGRQAVINFIGQHPGCSFQDIRHGTGLDPSVVNSALWQMNRDGRVKREGEYRSYRYTLAEQTTVTESTSADFHFSNHHCGANKLTNLFNQCLAGVRK